MPIRLEKPLTQNIHADGPLRSSHLGPPLSFPEYVKKGGYQALAKAFKISPLEIIQKVKDANLLGRGGGGFSTGLKWSLVPHPCVPAHLAHSFSHPRYVVANADEMEPGTFKDRLLMEGNPHLLIEGMLLAGYAIQASVGYIFLRWEYKKSEKILKTAIAEAYSHGYLGNNIRGKNYSFNLFIHTSAGRYICGEETALLNALEGRRAVPRAKPPYPAVSGLWGRPTIVNNVETFCNVPAIIREGVEFYKSLSFTAQGGTKIYGVSGKVNRPGAWELPMGTTLRELIENHAGGMKPGFKLRGLIPGGASTDFVTEESLDLRMDFASLQKAGSRMGTGTLVILDDMTCPVAFVLNLLSFFSRESCGWCTPCRDGLPWVTQILYSIENGTGTDADLEILHHHIRFLAPGLTFCALAPGAMEPLRSALKFFKSDFEEHIRKKCCPYRSSHGEVSIKKTA